jgi:predicted N-formylglutamate amidohydrolase
MDKLPACSLPLLGPTDPPAVVLENPEGQASVLLVCDHASNAIPAQLGSLGLEQHDLERHIALDIGARGVTRKLARLLDAPAVISGYSRLVIDCNRRPHHPDSIVTISDATTIPGNLDLSREDVQLRADACFWPYHRRIGSAITTFALRGIKPVIIAIHCFTHALGEVDRPWQMGVLWDQDDRVAAPVIDALRARGDLLVGNNEPYSGKARYGYSIEVHAGETGLPNVLFEYREDMVSDPDGEQRMAEITAEAFAPVLSDPALYQTMRF